MYNQQMPLRMWMYDLAREQTPNLDQLRTLCRLSLESGYNALGLNLEHCFRYPSAQWAAGRDCLEPSTVKILEGEFPELQIVPFINLLGHFEGFLYTEGGQRFAEETFKDNQACPSNEEFVELARNLVKDTVECFKSELIHIGGDETFQLGACPKCKARVEEWEKVEGVDGKARLYAEHFGPMAEYVISLGRRPAVWGDMFLKHGQALSYMPKSTLIFDWQYFGGCAESAPKFQEQGFDVVLSPTLQVYDAAWFQLLESEQNVRIHARELKDLNASGFCLATWECGLFGAYDTIFPAIAATGKLISNQIDVCLHPGPVDLLGEEDVKDNDTGKRLRPDFATEDSIFLAEYSKQSEHYEVWARLMGIELNKCGPVFVFSGWRSVLKARLLLNGNPFLLWLRHGEELCGPNGDAAYQILEEALRVAPTEATKGATIFVRSAIEFVRLTQLARTHYAAGDTERAVATLALTRQLFDDLAKIAKRTKERIGGSSVDIERCRVAKEHVERVIVRIRNYGEGALCYIPSFEHLTQHSFIPQDQAAWWLINRWVSD